MKNLTFIILVIINLTAVSQNPIPFLLNNGTPSLNFTHFSNSSGTFLTLGTDGKSAIAKQKLHLLGANILLTEGNGSNGGSLNGNVFFGSNGMNGVWGIEYYKDLTSGNGGLNFWNPGASYNTIIRNFALFLSDNGNIGIGTNNPNYNLHIKDDKNMAGIKIESNILGQIQFENCDGLLKLGTDKGFGIYTSKGTPRLTINYKGGISFNGENT